VSSHAQQQIATPVLHHVSLKTIRPGELHRSAYAGEFPPR
jgi:hypothetical protein